MGLTIVSTIFFQITLAEINKIDKFSYVMHCKSTFSILELKVFHYVFSYKVM